MKKVWILGILLACKVNPIASNVKPNTIKFAAGVQTTTTPPASWTVPFWVFDPANISGNASDSNTCTTTGAPCLHCREILRRWGTDAPRLSQQTVIQAMSDQPDESDSCGFAPIMMQGPTSLPGSLLNITGTPKLLASGTFGTLTAKSATSAITIDLGGNATLSQGMMIINTTRGGSIAWSDTYVGSIVTVTQPFGVSVTTPPAWWGGGNGGTNPPEVNTWTTGDSYQIVQPTKLYLEYLRPTTIGIWNSPDSGVVDGMLAMVGNIWIPDSSGENAYQSFLESNNARITQSRFDRYIETADGYDNGVGEQIFNSWLSAAGTFTSSAIYGGAINTGAPGGSQFGPVTPGQAWEPYLISCNCCILGATIAHGQIGIGIGSASNRNSFSSLSGARLDNIVRVDAVANLITQEYESGTYGTYTILVERGGRVLYNNPSAVSQFGGNPTLEIWGHTTAMAFNPAGSPAFLTGRSLTPTQLDTSVAGGGFGGVALGNDLTTGFFFVPAM